MRWRTALLLVALLAGCSGPPASVAGSTTTQASTTAGPACTGIGAAVAAPRVVGHFALGNGDPATPLAGMPSSLVERGPAGQPGAQRGAANLDVAGCVAFTLPVGGDYYLMVHSQDAQRPGCWWSAQVPFTHGNATTQDVVGKVYYACQ
ncbi:MAG: hypothetical protein QOI63_2074 [Thermoplasmata archaeon]|jgi:hypothetical protein|nr:hypothetical protein [Thermoplasmata archaeon]